MSAAGPALCEMVRMEEGGWLHHACSALQLGAARSEKGCTPKYPGSTPEVRSSMAPCFYGIKLGFGGPGNLLSTALHISDLQLSGLVLPCVPYAMTLLCSTAIAQGIPRRVTRLPTSQSARFPNTFWGLCLLEGSSGWTMPPIGPCFAYVQTGGEGSGIWHTHNGAHART